MTFPVLPANGPSGYNLTNSLRFRSSASAYLNRTPASAGNRQTWTWSGWFKRGNFAGIICLFSGSDNVGGGDAVFINTSDQLSYYQYENGTVRASSAAYRDPSAWYHFIFVSDTSNATAQNRFRMYVNGVEITAWATNSTITQNRDGFINFNSLQRIGNNVGATQLFDGYMAEVNFIDGQALTPSSFGSTNAITGVWQPAKYTGTYGTNGFYLPFTNTTSTTTLGNDFSGNGNNWTTNNISLTPGATYDAMTDVPTLTSATAANYCVLNPLNVVGATISGGNLNTSAGLAQGYTVGTIGIPSTGKYYFEVTNGSTTSPGQVSIGLQVQASPPTSFAAAGGYTLYLGYSGATANLYINNNGTNSSANVVSTTASDVLNLAYDASTGKLWLGYNNVWKNSSGATDGAANPATGANPTITISAGLSLFPFHHVYSNTASINFGQRPFAYTPPSGFVALNTFNLPSSTIPAGNKYMDILLYTGTAPTPQTVTGLNFQTDFAWVKARGYNTGHVLSNVIGGPTFTLSTDSTAAEYNGGTGNITAFNSNGITVGTADRVNRSGVGLVAWNWKAGGAAVTNTAGSSTSAVSANTTSGFSVVTYTGTGSAATVGHGLGVAPSMIIVKVRSTTNDWPVYHSGLPTPATQALFLDLTNAASTGSSAWNSTNPTSSVFSLGVAGSSNTSGGTYVAYCFAPIAGFSAFGSYTGNGSTDGPFVYLGFRPRFVMVKNTTNNGNWLVWDSSRSAYNAANIYLLPNTNAIDQTSGADIDILSNGFKIKNTTTSGNGSGDTLIYAAFAENPFRNALAR